MKPLDKLYWFRTALGVVTGLGASLLGFTGADASRGVLLVIAVYLMSYQAGRAIIAKDLPKEQRMKYITTGLWSYVILFLFTWILYHTLTLYPLQI